MTENPKHIQGMQDKRLEIGLNGKKRNWREKVTPTKDSDISQRAYAYMRLRDGLVLGMMELEGCRGDTKSPFYAQAQDQIDMVKDEARAFGFEYSTLELVAKKKIQRMKDKEAEEEATYIKQSESGDVPARGIIYKNGDK